MDNQIKVTFIVPVYKTAEKLLRGCIENIVKYGLKNYELILVDDGTPDNGGEICDEYASEYENVYAYHQENQGVSVARNLGIEKSRGYYLSFVDADDVVNVPAILECVGYMVKERLDIALCKWRRDTNFAEMRNSVEPIIMNRKKFDSLIYAIANQSEPYRGYCFGSPWAKAFRKDFIIENKLRFSPQLRKMQDRVFMMYCIKKDPKIAMIPVEGYCYVKNEDSIVNSYNKKIGEYIYKVAVEMYAFNKEYNSFTEKELSTVVCRLLLEFLGINILHRNNKEKVIAKKLELKNYCNKKIFKKALLNPDYSLFSRNEKIKLVLLRLRMYALLIQISLLIR